MLIKKELETINIQQYPEHIEINNDMYAVSVSIEKLKRSGNVLVIDIFETKTQELYMRFFSDGNTYLICTEWPAKAWMQKHPDKFLDYFSLAVSEADRKKAHSILKIGLESWHYSYNIKNDMSFFASNINSKKAEKARESKYELMNQRFNMYPDYPADLAEFCENKIFGYTYIFVSKIIKKTKRKALCGHCGHEYEVNKEDKPGKKGVCPECGTSGTYKGNWTGGTIENNINICIAHEVDNQLLLRWTKATRVFNSDVYKYEFYDFYRSLYLKSDKGKIIYSYDYKFVEQWGWNWYRKNNGSVYKGRTYVYTNNLREVFGDNYYHVNLQEGSKSNYELSFTGLLDNLKNIPAAEYLFKMGMPALASSISKESVKNEIGFTNVLGVNKQYLSLYRKYNVNDLEHEIIKSSKTWVSESSFVKLRALEPEYSDINDIDSLLDTMSFEHFVNYFTKQKELYKKMKLRCILTLYNDYLSMSHSLKVDMSRKSVRFPNDIKYAHDLILSRFNKVKHKVEDENFRQAVEKLYVGMKEHSDKEFCIVYPTSRSEFITEGQSLGHCVGNETYYKNHIEGSRMIYFVRKVYEPEKPYYTMEIDMKELKIRQLYGFGDCSAPHEVRLFANNFLKKLKPNSEKERMAS